MRQSERGQTKTFFWEFLRILLKEEKKDFSHMEEHG